MVQEQVASAVVPPPADGPPPPPSGGRSVPEFPSRHPDGRPWTRAEFAALSLVWPSPSGELPVVDDPVDPVVVDVEVDPAALERIRAAVGKAATDGLFDSLSPAATDLAESAFAAYVESAGGQTHDGKPIPAWADLGDDVRAHWRAAAGAVARRVALRGAR